jgi:hypothetical protein
MADVHGDRDQPYWGEGVSSCGSQYSKRRGANPRPSPWQVFDFERFADEFTGTSIGCPVISTESRPSAGGSRAGTQAGSIKMRSAAIPLGRVVCGHGGQVQPSPVSDRAPAMAEVVRARFRPPY